MPIRTAAASTSALTRQAVTRALAKRASAWLLTVSNASVRSLQLLDVDLDLDI